MARPAVNGVRAEDRRRWAPYRDATVVVTGGNGFIGRAVSSLLIEAGAEVHWISRSAGVDTRVRTHRANVAERDASRRILAQLRPDYVFHLAGRTNADKAYEHVWPTFDTNVAGTLNVLAGTLEANPACRVVCCASMEELWGTTIGASSPYGVSKRVASMYVAMFAALYDLAAMSLRPFFVYGPGRQPEGKLLPYVINELAAGRMPALRSVDRAMDWVYLDDVSRAFLHAGLSGRSPTDDPVDIGSGTLTRIGDVVRTVAEIMGRPLIEAAPVADGQLRELSPAADTSLAHRTYGWQPLTDLRSGLEATVEWYLGQRL
ncbi:MAG: NAD(P)-dependent oxidoreductase [Pseudomonadales bacterium]